MGILKKRKDVMSQVVPLLRGHGLDQLKGKDLLIGYFARPSYQSLNGMLAYADFEDIFMDTVNDFVRNLNTSGIIIQNYEAYFRRIFKNKVANFKMAKYDEFKSKNEYHDFQLIQNKGTGFDEELLEKLFYHIDQLSEQCRNLILMKFYESKSHQEIAELLKITAASSKVQLARCKKRLLQELLSKNK